MLNNRTKHTIKKRKNRCKRKPYGHHMDGRDQQPVATRKEIKEKNYKYVTDKNDKPMNRAGPREV
jgi:hypothetical protein